METKQVEIFTQNEYTVLKIRAQELDLIRSGRIMGAVDALLSDMNNIDLIINLDDVTYMDSSGLAFLYALKKKYSYKFRSVAVLSRSKSVQKIFSIFDMKKYFPFYENMESLRLLN